jgi:F420-dependent oxidoreductase-like protein
MRFGVFVPQGWRRDLDRIADPVDKFEAMTTVAKVADEGGGWDSIWVYDHFHTVPEPALEATFECWTITATLTRDTSRVKVGQMVGCNGYRNPALYAKIASTVDVASHGRLYAGFGAGWHEEEWKAFGYEWPETPERMAKFREAVEIIHKMWTEDYPEFNGKHYHIDKPINEPKGVQKPHIPLWLGGGGEQVTLKLVAKFADASNFGYSNPDVFKQKLDILKRHCENEGRDIDTITKSTSLFGYLLADGEDPHKIDVPGGQSREEFEKNVFIGTTDQFIEKFEQLRAAGVEYVIVYMPNVAYDQRQVRQFAQEIIPQFA